MNLTMTNTGTATVASGATNVVVTHGLSFTPDAAEIQITPTNSPTNDPGTAYVDTITSTQFTLHVRSIPVLVERLQVESGRIPLTFRIMAIFSL